MVWYKVKWIDPMFASFNTAFPQRTKGSDGTIGDTAHQAESSGHNPDDTSGVRAERSDADTKPEVRAADVTSNLCDSRSIKMIDVVHSILATPADRDRLIYIICDGKIWRKSNNWVQEKYDGGDQHYGHGHFSGDPASDENSSPWNSILKFQLQEETDMEFSDQIPGVPGLTVGEFMRDLWTHDVVWRGLTVDESGVPQRHPTDRWTAAPLATSVVTNLNAMNTTLQAVLQIMQAAGGGNLDTAEVITKMEELAQQELDRDNALKQENAELRQRLAQALDPQ